ncbi:helix-turn-helix domain-containing protein [Ensifer sp.]|jgi:chromosomal replication initiator protein|uniref:helix-turn-helix domain-containing protein n=1 Tax=Ensifer sp. TaxID=1872086 RepID=UPI002E144493|nr:helix-turn-helix domain-containing protein [Ensifer sp.]
MQPETTDLTKQPPLRRGAKRDAEKLRADKGQMALAAAFKTGREGGLCAKGTLRTGGLVSTAVAEGAGPASACEDSPSETLDELAGIVATKVKAQTRRITELELALADAEARILSQARLICAATLAADGDLFNRRSVREIVEEVLALYPGVSWEEVIGVGRERRLVEPRHRCMSAVYQERTDLSLPALGRIFHRDHTSVLHAVTKRERKAGSHRGPGPARAGARLQAASGADGGQETGAAAV